MPKNGRPFSRAYRTASIFPSIPRLSNPPGTSTHETGRAVDVAEPAMRDVIDQIGGGYGWSGTIPSEWWHVLDTKTGEVTERRHIRTTNGMVGFQRSDWVIGTPAKKGPIALPSTAESDLSELEVGLRSVVVNGIKSGGRPNAPQANGHTGE